MRKCLHVLPMDKLSGAEKMALLICENLNGYEPLVICGGENLKSIFQNKGIDTFVVDFKNNSIFKSAKAICKIAKNNKVDIVHAHDNRASMISYIAKILGKFDFKLISHIHNCYPWLKNNSKNKILDQYFRKRYDHNITCGKLVYDYYTKNTDYINENNTTSISNAIDIGKIKKHEMTYTDIDYIYEEFNIPKDKTIFGFVGRLSEQKGIIPFIKVLNDNKHKFKDCKFLLVGNGEEELEVRRIIKKLRLEELFILTGYQENVYKFYSVIDIFFLPSLYEGLPMVILEAMSFGKPIVSMNVGSINEVLEDGYNGNLVESGDLNIFINKLECLKKDKYTQMRFKLNGLKTIELNYNIEVYNRELIKVYNGVLKK